MTLPVRIQPGPRMSQAVIHAGSVHLAGQVALGAPGTSVAEQTSDILARIDALLAEAGSGRDKLVSATIWLVDIASFAEMNSVWDSCRAGRCARTRLRGSEAGRPAIHRRDRGHRCALSPVDHAG